MDDDAPEMLPIREVVTDPCDQAVKQPLPSPPLPTIVAATSKGGGCITCGSSDLRKKYKCPKCRSPYCSLECSKVHKETCTGVAAPPTRALGPSGVEGAASSSSCKRYHDELDAQAEENGWRLKQGELALLARASTIQQTLRDPTLRDAVLQVAPPLTPSMCLADSFNRAVALLGGQRRGPRASLVPLAERKAPVRSFHARLPAGSGGVREEGRRLGGPSPEGIKTPLSLTHTRGFRADTLRDNLFRVAREDKLGLKLSYKLDSLTYCASLWHSILSYDGGVRAPRP